MPSLTGTAPASGAANLPSAEQLCALLGADDWGQFGYVTAAQPEINTDGPGSAYCVFAGKSGAEGGLELDAFVDATVADAEETFDRIAAGATGGRQITLPGAEEVFIHPAIDDTFGAIVARTGRFTFTVTVPAGGQAEAQLLALAGIVLSRTTNLR